jgi:hypothetical protein
MVIVLSSCDMFDNQSFNKAKNPTISKNFDETLADYYYEDGTSNSITLFSFSSDISSILTVALQNKYQLKNIRLDQFSDSNNSYYLSILKTLYLGKDQIRLSSLNQSSLQRDFFIAFNAASVIQDKSLLNELAEIYKAESAVGVSLSNSEQIYKILNTCFTQPDYSVSPELTDQVKRYIENYSTDLQFNLENILDLNACLAYFELNEITDFTSEIKKIYDVYTLEGNEKYILAQPEMYAAIYIENIEYMNHYLKLPVIDNTFFHLLATNNPIVYKGILYDVTKPRNLALYLTALTYSSEDITGQQLQTLTNIVNSKMQSVNPEDSTSMFYLKLCCDILDIKYSFAEKNNLQDISQCTDFTQYYEFKINNVKTTNLQTSNNILEKLAFMDVSVSQDIVNELSKINIFDYKSNANFDVVLNFYVNLMLNSNMMNEYTKKSIIDYIKSYECVYGYSTPEGNYDFETSVYYTNIINILNGGLSSELR